MVYFKAHGEKGGPERLIPFVHELGVEVEEFSPQHRLVWLYLTFGEGQRVMLGESRDGFYSTRQLGYDIIRQIYNQVEKSLNKPNCIIDLGLYTQLMNDRLYKKSGEDKKDDD